MNNKLLYLDCRQGVSGDMLLGALVDLGVKPALIKQGVKAFGISGFRLKKSRVKRAAIAGIRLQVAVKHEKPHSYAQIKKLLRAGKASAWAKEKTLRVFAHLATAEGAVHGRPAHAGHFHEVGAVDALVDIIGTVVAVESLGVEKIISSPLALGSGTVKAAHGLLPVPAPATLALVKDCPVFQRECGRELTTPTGAALIKGLADEFAPLPLVSVSRTGYGAGARQVPGEANMLRVILARTTANSREQVIVMETNIDDMTPLAYEALFNSLFAAGALDVYLQTISMKRGRPAVKLSVITHLPQEEKLAKIILAESTTFGLRCHLAHRWLKERSMISVTTSFGRVRVKRGLVNGMVTDLSPEYADCHRLAKKTKTEFLKVYESAKQKAWEDEHKRRR